MIVILSALAGAIAGTLTARRRGGTRLDMLQFGAGYAIAFALAGLVITIVIDRTLV